MLKITDPLPKLVRNALDRLSRKVSYLAKFQTLDSWIFEEYEAGNDAVVECELRYFSYIYDFIIKQYWKEQIFVSPSFIEIAIYEGLLKVPKDGLLDYVQHMVDDYGLGQKSLVIFPLHSFGYSSADFKIYNPTLPSAFAQKDNFRVYAQTNSISKTIENIVAYAADVRLPNRSKIDVESIRHYHRTRKMNWLHANPVFIGIFRFSQWPALDNANIIRDQIRFNVTKLYFMKALSGDSHSLSLNAPPWSTLSINNVQTRDIKHFLTISTGKGTAEVLSLPVHSFPELVYEDTNVNIVLDLDTTRGNRWTSRIFNAIDVVRGGILLHRYDKGAEYLKFYRLDNSLKYFRRSMRAYNDEDRVVNLNSAFEICLLDDHTQVKRANMLARSWKLFRRSRMKRKSEFDRLLGKLIDERNRVIHSGYRVKGQVDFSFLYQLYARLIIRLVADLTLIDSTLPNYMCSYFENI